jgi:hypothetical protein
MKSFRQAMIALALMTAGAAAADTKFPPVGIPYPEARDALLDQGLTRAPDTIAQPNRQYPECDEDSGRWLGKPVCNAYFLETDPRGWKHYVIVVVYRDTMTIADVHYPSTPEGHIAIPGPFAKGIPAIRDLSYFAARKVLRHLGYRPARNRNTAWIGEVCADRRCSRYIRLPEAGCSGTGAAFCTMYWFSPDKRILKVTTAWEYPEIYFAEWSSAKALKDDFDKLPD